MWLILKNLDEFNTLNDSIDKKLGFPNKFVKTYAKPVINSADNSVAIQIIKDVEPLLSATQLSSLQDSLKDFAHVLPEPYALGNSLAWTTEKFPKTGSIPLMWKIAAITTAAAGAGYALFHFFG